MGATVPIQRSIYSKRDVLTEMLAEGTVSLVIDGRLKGVCVPEHLKKAPLVLDYGYSMPIPIPDLELTDEGVSATLSFDRSRLATFVPWSAVVGAMQPGRLQVVWEVLELDDEPKKPRLSLVTD